MIINRKSLFGVIKSFCVILAVLVWVLTVSYAYARHTGVAPRIIEESILVNGQDPETLCDFPLSSPTVTIHVEGEGSAPPGRAEQYFLIVGWGDGTVQLLRRDTDPPEIVFTPPTGRHVDFDFIADVSHAYPDVEASYIINMKFFHTEPGGQDSPADAEVDIEICIRQPLEPTSNADLTLVNGEVPGFSCPFEPISRDPISGLATIRVEGGGEFTPLAGDTTGWAVEIDWADGTVQAITPSFTTVDNIDFMFTFVVEHGYLDDVPSVPPAMILVDLLQNNESVVTPQTIDICIFTPLETTLVVDPVSGDPSGSSACPVNAFLGLVTIEGGGDVSAPLGSEGQIRISVDWDDGTPIQTIFPTFDPPVPPGQPIGVPVNIMYDFVIPHGYDAEGTYDVVVTLFDSGPLGQDNLILVEPQTFEIVICLPRGTITGAVTDSESGLPIIGAVVEDVTDEPATPGSFFSLNNYSLETLEGDRRVRVSAQGWDPQEIVVFGVVANDFFIQDFQLVKEETSLNVVIVTLPVGPKPHGNEAQLFLLPQCVEAVVDGVVVQTVCVHAGNTYCFIGLPDGVTTFRGLSPFYVIDPVTKKLNNDELDPGDDAPNKGGDIEIELPANVPEQVPGPAVRVAVLTGSVNGVTDSSVSLLPIGASVYATFDFQGVPVTVTIESNAVTGAFQIDLLPPPTVDVFAQASSNRSFTVPTSIVGGEVEPVGNLDPAENLTLALFNEQTENFVPMILSPPVFNINEDAPDFVLMKDNFLVTDFDHTFSVDHTLQVYPGFNYMLNSTGVFPDLNWQLVPDDDFHGVLGVPLTMSDGTNTSATSVLTVNVSSILDDPVYVDFDTGEPFSEGGTGGVNFPLLTLLEALSEVAADGTIQISGLAASRENSLRINQAVRVENNNDALAPVSIDPKFARQAADTGSTAESGFITRSGRPRE